MSKQKRCNSSREIFKNIPWKSIYKETAQILFNRVKIMRAFIRLRALLSTHKELAGKLSELEKRFEGHDEKIQVIFQAIRELMLKPEPKRKKIGFIVKEKQRNYGRLKP
jgi:uncharacterized membrane protein